jgi:hypothetical protein
MGNVIEYKARRFHSHGINKNFEQKVLDYYPDTFW